MHTTADAEGAAADVKDAAADAKDAVDGNLREAFRSRWMEWGARIGMVARSIVYFLIAWLAIQVAFGHHKEADQNGALRSVARSTGGPFLLGLLAAAFGTYALWRLAVTYFGEAGQRDGRARLGAAVGFFGGGGGGCPPPSPLVWFWEQSGGGGDVHLRRIAHGWFRKSGGWFGEAGDCVHRARHAPHRRPGCSDHRWADSGRRRRCVGRRRRTQIVPGQARPVRLRPAVVRR